jgi:Family of unknown function (DUF6352)
LSSGLQAGATRGWRAPDDAFLRSFLAWPQLALVEESCAAERRLHELLTEAPARSVDPARLAALQDADARDNYALFLAFRDRLLAAGTLESAYLALMRGGAITLPPAFIDALLAAIVEHFMADTADAFEARAADLLVRPQRCTRQNGKVLCADRDTVDQLADSGGFGELGRLLRRGDVPWRKLELAVLSADNGADFWRARGSHERHRFVLDLSHQAVSELGHGVQFTLARTHSGSKALARVLERWLLHMIGVVVQIEPLQAIDDPAWRWHIGLDAEASMILNQLYDGTGLAPGRLESLIGLFRLSFANRSEMRADVAGKRVYLGLAHDADGMLRLKPQNLLLNLPLARPM